MSKYIYLLIFFLGFIVGCGKNSDPVGPVDTTAADEPNWIALPSGENSSLEKSVITGEFIWGYQGAVLNINAHYAAYTPFHFISIKAKAEIQKNSFEGWTFVTMSINDKYGVTTFSPEQTFSKPVIYNLTIKGLDLSAIDPPTVQFVYMAPDGQYQKAEYDRLIVDKGTGTLQVVNAKIPHFSRYGFAN
ncbi:MAG TPA: hypothetical protein VMT35_04140 [Ignavibacteriaceae bacterium]|nr:hypothetical protein [Ignavibacteriaceae bacterium]